MRNGGRFCCYSNKSLVIWFIITYEYLYINTLKINQTISKFDFTYKRLWELDNLDSKRYAMLDKKCTWKNIINCILQKKKNRTGTVVSTTGNHAFAKITMKCSMYHMLWIFSSQSHQCFHNESNFNELRTICMGGEKGTKGRLY